MLWIPLAIGAFLGVLLIGAAVLGALGNQKRWRGYAHADSQALITQLDLPPAFEPLEMEPFSLRWPSEIKRKKTALPEPPWPSETWDDLYFGARARDDLRKAALARKASEATRERAVQRDAEAQHQGGKKKKSKAKKETQRAAREQESREALRQTRPQGDQQGPTPEQVAQMVKQYGLAGAVEQIRDKTGWDFRTAAQYLANTLRDQR